MASRAHNSNQPLEPQLLDATTKGERDQAIVQAIRRSQRALSRELTEAFTPSVTRYSLDYLNTSGRFSPEQILLSFRRRPKGTVLLYGPPGTGKTQFTEHLASELDLPLVSKSASALLSKWLGDSEKNTAAAFEEAAAEDAILFFDEGDSFLRSRERAQHSWEVTQTNELLRLLTPGDFATVKRQCLVLNTVLTPEEWLDQLEIECQIKNSGSRIEERHRAA